jgi:6-phosphofructokinase 1
MTGVRRIGVLSGGGDCPGINAVIRGVTLDAIASGIEVVGIRDGFLGLIEDRLQPLREGDVRDILTLGGSILGCSNKANPSRYPARKNSAPDPVFEDVSLKCLRVVDRERLDAIVCIGGDGTMTCAQSIAFPRAYGHDHGGVNCIGVPKTIDNDIMGTDLTFGFQSAVAVASEALDRVRTTAQAHHRTLVVEVMGRNAGWLALWAGLAGGADAILVPEIPFEHAALERLVRSRHAAGNLHCVVCVAEGARPCDGSAVVSRIDPLSPDPIRFGGVGRVIAEELERRTGVETRYVVLGHVQRGGSPVPSDRVLATHFAHHAMELVHAAARNRMVVWSEGRVGDIDLSEPAGKQRRIGSGEPLVAAARRLGVGFADA